MTEGDRDGLVARIRQVRRLATTRARPKGDEGDRPLAPLQALEVRVAHLEQLLEGLQDSVHRESERHDREIAELQRQIHPATMGAAIANDTRDRGL